MGMDDLAKNIEASVARQLAAFRNDVIKALRDDPNMRGRPGKNGQIPTGLWVFMGSHGLITFGLLVDLLLRSG